MFRLDAQHAFAPPQQGPDWYAKILARNKFQGSIYVPSTGTIAEALTLAAQNPYIRRVVPRLDPDQLDTLPDHPLIVSVHLRRPTPAALTELHRRGLAVECDACHWPLTSLGPVVLTSPPADGHLPENIFVKLTGFRLPATADQTVRLRQLLRHPGPEKLMFASDWPGGGATWKETLAAFTQSLGAMPIALREQLLGVTAAAFYRL